MTTETIEIKGKFTGEITRRGLVRSACYDVSFGTIEVTVDRKADASAAVALQLRALAVAPAPMVRLQKDGRILVARITGCNDAGVLSLALERTWPDGRSAGSTHCDLRTGEPGGDYTAERKGVTVDASPRAIACQVKRELDYELERINGCT